MFSVSHDASRGRGLTLYFEYWLWLHWRRLQHPHFELSLNVNECLVVFIIIMHFRRSLLAQSSWCDYAESEILILNSHSLHSVTVFSCAMMPSCAKADIY